MKYLLIDCIQGDQFETEFDTLEKALKECEQEWQHLTNHDKKEGIIFTC